MNRQDLSRRQFLQGSGSLASLAALRGALPGMAALAQAACSARDAGADFTNLDARQARELEAIAARIIPLTDTPGARETGVIWFIDGALGDFMADSREFLLAGLDDFQAGVFTALGRDLPFSGQDEADQDRYLATVEDTPFFGLVSMLTVCGMFAMPKYGGNRDHAGWRLLGLDPHAHAHSPPFGHYDAAYREETTDGD